MIKLTSLQSQRAIDLARETLAIESDAILNLQKNLNGSDANNFTHAIEILLDCKGRIVVSGIGKSGHIGHKIAATFASTGSPAFFVHPAEASHGDLGMVTQHDVFVAFSNSGETSELTANVRDVMRSGKEAPSTNINSSVTDALLEITAKRMGMTVIIDDANKVKGIFTDGDLRRLIEKNNQFQNTALIDAMTPSPRTISPELLAAEAVEMMERYKINQLVVVDEAGCLLGALNLHDLFAAQVI
jgi:D-arabinose 5-phosphate isomerase GutQ